MSIGLFIRKGYQRIGRNQAIARAIGRGVSSVQAEGLERRVLLTTFVVTDPGDPLTPLHPGVTLRDAILASNLVPGPNTIAFNLPAGSTTIQPVIPLPAVNSSTLIDGTTQPGYAGTPIIWIQATPTSSGSNGLTLSSGTSGVKGLAVTGFTGGAGVELGGANDLIDADFLGIDPSGGVNNGNRLNTAEVNQYGAKADGAGDVVRNSVLSNNQAAGLRITGDNTQVTGNLIGTDPTGEQARSNDVAGVELTTASNVTIGGTTVAARNVISGNFNDAIVLTNPGSGDIVEGNYIGIDAAGATAVPMYTASSGNGGYGIYLQSTTPGATTGLTVGGTAAGAGNVIAGNQIDGVFIQDASGNTVAGNLIGTSATGNVAVGNEGDGVQVTGNSSNNSIGGAGTARNVISANAGDGVTFDTGSTNSGNVVTGNFIGTDISGSAALANSGNGITVLSNITIGASGAGNTISGNSENGIELDGSGNTVVYNNIGVQAADPSAGLGNGVDGVRVLGSNNVIGTTTAGNNIGYNVGNGVTVGLSPADTTAIQNSIRGNNIYYNGKLGIDLGNDGVTYNDPEDPDVGPNLLQNFPVLTSVTLSGNTATISGTLNSTPLSTFAIDFFSSQIWDTTHYGEGQKYLGSISVTTDATGNASFTATMPGVPSGFNYFAATATDSNGNTSEFAYDPVAGTHPATSSRRHRAASELLHRDER